MARRTYINMMLTADYVPDWGQMKAFRELYANAVDADPNYRITMLREGAVKINTETAPSLTEMILLGAGTKSNKTNTIGQFGEGAKLAALILTRERCRLSIVCPKGKITFMLKTAKHFDQPTLHAIVDEEQACDSGCTITFQSRYVVKNHQRFFLPRGERNKYGAMKKEKKRDFFNLYHRGVLVNKLTEPSIWDWNVKDVKINRDRDYVNTWDVRDALCEYVETMLADWQVEDSEDIPLKLLKNQGSLETRSLSCRYHLDHRALKALTHAFYRHWGEKAVLSCGDSKINARAIRRGYVVVSLDSAVADHLIRDGEGVIKADQVTSLPPTMVSAEKLRSFGHELEELALVSELIGFDGPVYVYEDDGESLGLYKGGSVWISERVMKNQTLRISTLIHEVAHNMGGDDETSEFEASLEMIAAKLAVTILTTMKKEAVDG